MGTISIILRSPDVARRRAQWKKYQGRLDPSRLVFIDETWAKTNMARTHGRARRGERLVAKAPHRRGRTLSFLAALRHDGIDAPCVIDGPINGENFLAYVEQVLVPALKPGDIGIIDNLGSYRLAYFDFGNEGEAAPEIPLASMIKRVLTSLYTRLWYCVPFSV